MIVGMLGWAIVIVVIVVSGGSGGGHLCGVTAHGCERGASALQGCGALWWIWILDCFRKPCQSINKTFSRGSTRRLNPPNSIGKLAQLQSINNLTHTHTMREILLVGKDQQHRILQFARSQYSMKLYTSLMYSVSVLAVHHKDECLGACVIVSPKWPNLVLATDILHKHPAKK